MFVLQTTATYPDLIAKIYKINHYYCFIFVIYLIVQFLLITNLFLCVVCEINKKIFGAKILHRFNESTELLKEVWKLTCIGNNDNFIDSDQFIISNPNKMTKLQYLALLHGTDNYGKGKLTDIKKEIIWHAISTFDENTRQRYVTKMEFIRCIPWFLGTRIILFKLHNKYWFNTLCENIVKFEVPITSNFSIHLLGFIFDLITIIQCILTFILLSCNHCKLQIRIAMGVIDIIWIFEILIRLCGMHWRYYVRSRHLLNGIITIIVIIVTLLDENTNRIQFERLDDSIELLRLFSVVNVFAKYVFPDSIYRVVNAMTYSLRSSATIMIHLILAMYSFAVIGMDLFGHIDFQDMDKVDKDETNHYIWGSSLIEDSAYQSFNFHSFWAAMHQSFIGLIANNWHVFMFGYAQIYNREFPNSWTSLIPYFYFIVLMVVIPSILLQLFCAVLLDMYDCYSHHQKQFANYQEGEDDEELQETGSDHLEENKIKIHDYTMEKLQISADELYPNKYKVDCFDIRLNHFYELPHKDTKGIKYWAS